MSLTATAFSNFYTDSFEARKSKCDPRAVCRDPRIIRRARATKSRRFSPVIQSNTSALAEKRDTAVAVVILLRVLARIL